jgi:outer membrane receptor for ferrienterochelin and colicins
MKTISKITINLIIFMLVMTSNGQQISGRVFEQHKKQKMLLPGVNIYWEGTQSGTVSDENGRFRIEKPTDNSIALISSFIGYVNDTLQITSIENELEIILEKALELEEVIVTGRHRSSFVSQISPLHVHNISSAELQKAACCNLSESFETNASVDVSYSDAVTGAKRIELLGLHGKYTQMMTENIPNLRGLSTPFGLTYIPGPWMESIQISKGASTVVNGYESITGQINVEFKKPDNSEKLYLNAFVNHEGRLEGNFNSAVKINEKWSTMLYGHAGDFSNKIDYNHDSFLDDPLTRQYNFFNRWKYSSERHMAQVGFRVIDEERAGGQIGFDKTENPGQSEIYGINIKTSRYEAWGKTGYAFMDTQESSIAFMNSFTYHEQNSLFGIKSYEGRQDNYYANLIFQSNLGSHRHKYNTGASYNYDAYRESLNDSIFQRTEHVPGIFLQYTYSIEHNLTILAGIRSDFHNIWGTFFTPRFHLKYNLTPHTILRTSAGKGYRSPNIIAENSYILASSRRIIFETAIQQEEAWNYGVNLMQIMDIRERELNINVEFYRTHFVNQMIIDRDRNVNEVNIYNLAGQSFSNSYQVEVFYELIPRLDVVAAFRYSDVRMTVNEELQREPLVNRYKGLANFSYKTSLEKWQFDFTAQLNGDARIPSTTGNPQEYQRPESSPAYTILNTQVTRYFRNWNIYAGVENLSDFMQHDPIIAADDPFGDYFDSSLIWGPIMGRKFYAGIKYYIN